MSGDLRDRTEPTPAERLIGATEKYAKNAKASNDAMLDIIQQQDNFLQMLLVLTDDINLRRMIHAQRAATELALIAEAERFNANSIRPENGNRPGTAHS